MILGLILFATAAVSLFLGGLMLVGAYNVYWKDLNQFGQALVPGMVVSHQPTIVVCLVDLGREQPDALYWVTRLDFTSAFKRFPVGTRLPCYATFEDKQDPERWRTAYVHPIRWGTSDPFNLQACIDLIGEAQYAKLEACVREGKMPEHGMHHVVLNGHLQVFDTESLLRPSAPANSTAR